MAVSGANASKVGIVVGVLLAVLGIGAYVLTDFASLTALFPAMFGVLCVFLGRIGLETRRERGALLGLGVVAGVGIAGSIRGLGDGVRVLTGETVERPVAAGSQSIMALLCLVLLVTVVLSILGNGE